MAGSTVDDLPGQGPGLARRFLVVGHTQSTDPRFALNDLCGIAGRIDVMARAVTSALCLSHGVREDTELWCAIDHEDVVEGPRVVRFRGDRIRHLNPDERSTAALFRKAFATDVVDDGHWEAAHDGVEVAEMRFGAALARFAEAGPVILLDRDAPDLRDLSDAALGAVESGGPGFVLSDHLAFSTHQMQMLEECIRGRVSVGPRWLHGNAAVTLVHDELDRRAARRPDGDRSGHV